ncbi:MAG: ABC transporter ATP-binding protein [Ruminobacter sp.]|jgi:NitT/TauT family transport system ATP-binding protein|uniref:NitT/TauT family transport system ATP-binding protein n=1 Tax=Ruminobacter amylophilus TaxID=867 RepID=A0A662ZJN7_9GAMM|nr:MULTISPECIES: ABC transporter ATP-binding protein [Ruminobacter]MBQ3775726.1 ABC transporter ATP-binding protein [Ruminobacter sp.]SFP57864.1 NitT/TauT family transport system ATP-binding protein [Ruminobacter amylophilus]
MNKIEIDNISLTYHTGKTSFQALSNVSFNIQDGEFVSIIGSSGCGKSSLLGILEGLTAPTSGQVRINGKDIQGPGKERSVVFQQYALFPWMTAEKNVAFGLKQVKPDLSRKERLELANVYLQKVGLAEAGKKYPRDMSGGMQQRVAIARALAMDTEILLMDEPFGAVDAKNRVILQELLLKLWEGDGNQKKKTVVFVTHDVDEAILLSDRIIMMKANPGQVNKEIKVPLPRPRNRSELVKTQEYSQIRNEIMALFFGDIKEKIDQEAMI